MPKEKEKKAYCLRNVLAKFDDFNELFYFIL